MRASTWLLVTCAAWCAITAVGEGVGLRDESDVEKMREEALSKLEKPLEKMKAKELKALLTERGVTCTACSEKDQLVAFVRENIHLPVKKETLKKFANMPRMGEDDDVQALLKEIKKKKEQEDKMKETLKKAGIDTSGMSFGGGFEGIDPEQLAKAMKDVPKS